MRLSRIFAVATAAAAFAVVAPSAHADDLFLKVDGVVADEQPVQGTTGYIAIRSFEWGGEAPRSIGASSGGAGIGKAQLNKLTVVKSIDATSPAFIERFGSGTTLKFAEIVVRKGGPTSAGVISTRYCFQTAFVTDIKHAGDSGDGVEETIQLAYGAAGMTFVKQDTSGKPVGTVFSGWNVMTNQLLTSPAPGCAVK